MGQKQETRDVIIEAAYGCLAHYGPSRTSVEDVAQAAGVSRATMYRYFPGGRDQLINDVVAWEFHRFFVRLYEAVRDAETLEEVMERGLFVAHRAIKEHEVLQMVLRTEPEALDVVLESEVASTRVQISEFLLPYLERHELAPGVEPGEAAGFLSRMVLSYIGAQGSWDLSNPEEVSRLVRAELLAGIVPREPRTLTLRQI
ncbi:MAG: TetR/AcrR family transcriptional regulator [Actinomycetes bacterium]|jgi:hypothetical protein